MNNIWRNSPGNRLQINDLIQKKRGDNQQIIASGFWQTEGITYYGILKRWTGAIWIKEPLKTYLGNWQNKPLKRWDGNNWLIIDATGA